MPNVTSFRLDPETQQAIDALARRRKRSRSEVIRAAIAALVERESSPERPFDIWRDSIGVITGGRDDLSVDTGKKLAALLRGKATRRHR